MGGIDGATVIKITGMLAQATGVAAYVSEDPVMCVARGTGIALENLESYKRSILSAR